VQVKLAVKVLRMLLWPIVISRLRLGDRLPMSISAEVYIPSCQLRFKSLRDCLFAEPSVDSWSTVFSSRGAGPCLTLATRLIFSYHTRASTLGTEIMSAAVSFQSVLILHCITLAVGCPTAPAELHLQGHPWRCWSMSKCIHKRLAPSGADRISTAISAALFCMESHAVAMQGAWSAHGLGTSVRHPVTLAAMHKLSLLASLPARHPRVPIRAGQHHSSVSQLSYCHKLISVYLTCRASTTSN
jgi:hypothetical protein